jgi:hypothetical protein
MIYGAIPSLSLSLSPDFNQTPTLSLHTKLLASELCVSRKCMLGTGKRETSRHEIEMVKNCRRHHHLPHAFLIHSQNPHYNAEEIKPSHQFLRFFAF